MPKKASYTVASFSVFGRVSVDDRQKHIKGVRFHAKRTDENTTKTLVGSKILCFVFVETNTVAVLKTH